MRKRNKIIYWIATVWMSLGMVSTAIGQLIKMKDGQGGLDMLNHLGYPAYLLAFLGICKILAVIVILMPRVPVLKEWAYAGLAFMMIGAIYSHIANGEAIAYSLPAFSLLILTLVSWYFRPAERKVVLAS